MECVVGFERCLLCPIDCHRRIGAGEIQQDQQVGLGQIVDVNGIQNCNRELDVLGSLFFVK